MDPGADLLAADADAASAPDGALDFDKGAGGQRARWQGGGGRAPGGPAASCPQPGQILGLQVHRVSLEQLAVAEDMQGGGVQAQGDLLPGQRRAEPDLAPGGEESTRSSSSRPSNVSNNVASGSGSPALAVRRRFSTSTRGSIFSWM